MPTAILKQKYAKERRNFLKKFRRSIYISDIVWYNEINQHSADGYGDQMKEKLKEIIKKIVQFLLNPRFVFCFGLAWMITNGWCYIFIGVGTFYDIGWMIAVGTTYLAFLWLPFTPEKIVTVPIAIAFLKWFFPKDEKTLAVLQQMYQKAKEALKSNKKKKKEKNNAPESDNSTGG